MAETNPRSKLHSMKRQYFLVTFLLAISLFLVVYLPMEILFTIFEVGPYVRLAIIAALFVADYVAVNFIVNRKLQSKWIREASPMLDTIQAPEPEYIMDEETAKQIEATQRMEVMKKNNTFFSRLYRALAPTEDPEEELHPTAELQQPVQPELNSSEKPVRKTEPKKPEAAKGKLPVKAEAAEQDNKRSSKSRRQHSRKKVAEEKPAVPEPVSGNSSWQTKVEDMKTADYADVVKALQDAGETVEPIKETNASPSTSNEQHRVPSRRRRRQQQEAETKRSAERMRQRDQQEHASEQTETNQKETSAHRMHRNKKPSDIKTTSRKEARNESAKQKKADAAKKHRRSKSGAKSNAQVQTKPTTPVSNWSTPLDEMKTEELETAVEKAMRQGYNPISNERNK